MVDASRTIEIIFNALDQTGSGMSSVAGNLNDVADKASKVTEPLSNIAEDALKAEAAILALGATFLTVAVNEASKFGEKVEEIGSLVNDTPEQVSKLKGSIQDFAAVSNSSNFDQINQAMYLATSNLGSTSTALDILTVAEKGAIVGATGLDSSTALLTRTMNAYGLVSDDSATNTANAERVMAAMFTTVQNGDINMQSLSDNFGKVASTASAAHIPIETMGAAVAALTGAGVNGEQSMTLLNSLIKELLAPSDDLTKALGGLSVTTDGLPAVMDKLKSSTGGSADKLYALFSSSEAAKGALILANDSAGKFHGTLKAMDTSVQDFNANYTNMVGGVEDSTIRLENNTKILLQKVGEPLQDGWAGILDGLTSVMHGFSLSIDAGAFKPVFDALVGFEGDIADVLKQIGVNLPAALNQVDFIGLIAALKDLGFEFGDLFGHVDLSTPEGLAHAIQFVVDSVESLTRVVSGIVDVWGPVVQGFIAGIDTFNGLDDGAKKTAGQFLGLSQVFETLKGAVLTGADALDVIGKALVTIAGVQASGEVVKLSTALLKLPGGGVLSGVTTSLGATGLAGAAVLAAGAVGYTAGSGLAWGIDQLISKATGSQTTLGAFIYDVTHSGTAAKDAADNTIALARMLDEISRTTGVTVRNVDELNKALDDGKLVINEATGAYEAAGTGVRDFDAEVAAATQGQGSFIDQANAVAESLGLVNDKGEKLVGTFSNHKDAMDALSLHYSQGKDQFIRYEDGMFKLIDTGKDLAKAQGEVAKAVEDTTKSNIKGSTEWVNVMKVMQDATNSANDFRIKAEELNEKRYEANLTANVDLKVAEIEAQTARIQAAFNSLDNGITSTGQTLSSLADTFANSGNLDEGKQRFLRDIVDAENKRRQQEFDLQKELIGNQNDLLKAKINRMNSGQALITVDSGTLAPELDSLFEKVLKHVQIKATEEGQSLLLGLGAD